MDAVAFMRGNRAYFEDFMTRSTYHSNAIEGSTLSYAETYAILWNDNSLQVTATARELYEAINHKYALSLALEEMQVTLSERLVKRIAQAINKNINEIGGYRTISVLIRGAEHIPPKPNQVNQLMMQLVHEYNHADDVDPYLREARFHIRFERVHPFEDGNGRTGGYSSTVVFCRRGWLSSSFRSSAALNILRCSPTAIRMGSPRCSDRFPIARKSGSQRLPRPLRNRSPRPERRGRTGSRTLPRRRVPFRRDRSRCRACRRAGWPSRAGCGSSRSRPPGMTRISTARFGRAWAPRVCRGWGWDARAALLMGLSFVGASFVCCEGYRKRAGSEYHYRDKRTSDGNQSRTVKRCRSKQSRSPVLSHGWYNAIVPIG